MRYCRFESSMRGLLLLLVGLKAVSVVSVPIYATSGGLAGQGSDIALGKLTWKDCGDETDLQMLHLVAYSHSPDPIVWGHGNNISKTWRYEDATGQALPLRTLTETVEVARRQSDEEQWVTYFNNSFDLCTGHPKVCHTTSSGVVFDIARV